MTPTFKQLFDLAARLREREREYYTSQQSGVALRAKREVEDEMDTTLDQIAKARLFEDGGDGDQTQMFMPGAEP